MFWYIIKRIALFIPTFLVVSVIGFWLFSLSPSNPFDKLLVKQSSYSGYTIQQQISEQEKQWVNTLGLNLPVFYFSLNSLAMPDTIYKIYDKKKLTQYKQLLALNGNHQIVSNYLSTTLNIGNACNQAASANNINGVELQIAINNLSEASNLNTINFYYDKLVKLNNTTPILTNEQFGLLMKSINNLQIKQSKYKNYIPKLVWHGANNQYHQWVFGGQHSKGIIRGDFGISYTHKIPVIHLLKEKMLWSVCLGIISIILAYVISVPLSFFLVSKRKTIKHKITNSLLFVLYCLPSYFAGVLLLLLFANPDVLALFPPSGIKPIYGYTTGASFFDKLTQTLPYLILPLICYTYSSITLITKTLTTSIEQELTQNYITTAKAKGLSEKQIKKHAFKNSLLPMITLFSQLFPYIIGGSVIVESIFTIPGLGLETVKSVVSQDYPVVIAILTIATFFTLVSYFVADILCVFVDPRISLKSKSR